MFDWLGDAWDGFTGLFGDADSSSLSSTQSDLLNDIDISGDGTIGGVPISSYGSEGFAPDLTNIGSNDGYNSVLGGYDFGGGKLSKVDPKADAPWYTNPNVLGSAITAGAGLFGNMSALDARKEEQRANREAQKMNSLLELAKLKHSILKGSSGTGGAVRSGGGANEADNVRRQYSANKISQLSNLGANLANIYGG